MTSSQTPLGLVAVSACFYGLVFRATRHGTSPPDAASLRAISAGHAALTTLLAVYVLRQPQWETETDASSSLSKRVLSNVSPLDDSFNPIIRGRSTFGNAITAFETGYLLYDSCAMISTYGRRQGRISLTLAWHTAPLMMGHHVVLVSALLYLQVYIARGKERGIWVILAFLAMNATNPLLHARWWARKVGKDPKLLDFLFTIVFAVVRFGIPVEVMRNYGAYHHIGPFQAFKRLRTPCKVGTSVLVGLNGVWWMFLAKALIQRQLRRREPWRPI